MPPPLPLRAAMLIHYAMPQRYAYAIADIFAFSRHARRYDADVFTPALLMLRQLICNDYAAADIS